METATTIRPYKSTDRGHLSFDQDELIEVWVRKNEQGDSRWWYGTSVWGKRTGWFPGECVQLQRRGNALAGRIAVFQNQQHNPILPINGSRLNGNDISSIIYLLLNLKKIQSLFYHKIRICSKQKQ